VGALKTRRPAVSDRPQELAEEVDSAESPFAIAPIEGLPFAKDSEEARAIREILAEADREQTPTER
jgi:hypothetical protein